MVTVEGSSWTEDVTMVGLLYSSPVLTSTTSILVICLAICVKQNSKAATFNTLTRTCNCYNSLFIATPVTGNRLWKRKFTQVEGYVYNSQLDWFIKVVNDQLIIHTDAETFCNADGGRLVVLDTDEKFAYVTGLPDIQISEYYHLGADDIAVEDTFVWTTGGVVNRNRPPWPDNQPDNYLESWLKLRESNIPFIDYTLGGHLSGKLDSVHWIEWKEARPPGLYCNYRVICREVIFGSKYIKINGSFLIYNTWVESDLIFINDIIGNDAIDELKIYRRLKET